MLAMGEGAVLAELAVSVTLDEVFASLRLVVVVWYVHHLHELLSWHWLYIKFNRMFKDRICLPLLLS